MIKFALEDSESKYSRKGNDLIYTHSIKLADALTSAPVRFTTLDGRDISLNLDQVLTPQSVHCMEGEGMPIKSEVADPAADLSAA
jgi:DnaJ family protein B protein 4|tara:strand:- start:252 stop:506 length:255 start_codon:yes stop_codon:yes gene_type:complete